MEDLQKARKDGLREAVRNGATTAISRLLRSEGGQSLTACSNFDGGFCNLLMSEAIEKGHCAVVKLLVQDGFDAGGDHQDVPHLHRAITCSRDDIVRVLVQSGARATDENKITGKTSLHIAAASSNADVLDFLIANSNGTGRNTNGFNLGNYVSTKNRLHSNKENDFLNKNLDFLTLTSRGHHSSYQHKATNSTEDDMNNNPKEHSHCDSEGTIGFTQAPSRRGHSENGLTVNILEARDKVQGNTALHMACAYNNDKTALCLLHHGAEPNPLNHHGDTPLAKLLQPVTRKGDDSHNRSRLVLARRLVALGLIVEKKFNSRSARTGDMRSEITLGPGSGVLITGSGSTRSNNGPRNKKAATSDESTTESSKGDDDNQIDYLIRRSDLDINYNKIKSGDDKVKVQPRSDYTNKLGRPTPKGKDMSGNYNDLIGLQGYAACDVGDKCGGKRENMNSGSRAKQIGGAEFSIIHGTSEIKPQTLEDLEAQLEALCHFQAAESSESEPDSPSYLGKNIGSETSTTGSLFLLKHSDLTPRQRESLTRITRTRKSRDTKTEPEKSKRAGRDHDMSRTTAKRTGPEGSSAINQALKDNQSRRTFSDSNLETVSKSKPAHKRREMLSIKPNSDIAKNPEVKRDHTNHLSVLVKDKNFLPVTKKNIKSQGSTMHQRGENPPSRNGQENRPLSFPNSQHQRSIFPSSSLPSPGFTTREGGKSKLHFQNTTQESQRSVEASKQSNDLSLTTRQSASGNGKSRSLLKDRETSFSGEITKSTPAATQTRTPLKEMVDVPLNQLNIESIDSNQENTGIEKSGAQTKADKFRFPSRDERIRLRFKRLLGELSATLTLQQLCRLAILRSLSGRRVAESVDKLGLPMLMQNFLLRDDLF